MNTRPSITNRQLRRMGWLSFAVAVTLSILAVAFEGGQTSHPLVFAFLAHTGVCFGLPTVRNVAESATAK